MFWYYVSPYTVAPYAQTKWTILFLGNQRRPYIYGSRDAAVRAAVQAAEGNYKSHGVASGVLVKNNGGWSTGVSFGTPPNVRLHRLQEPGDVQRISPGDRKALETRSG
ncbi:hypothetical protein ACFPOA_00240 [Lysobacter niabensis]|uniref:hypothetical protein n=1 Tax=Agrilutibacter niabensis TaxID=380628 RepID=UPI003615ACE2